MRIFMFKSRPKPSLRAFAGESTGARLPAKYGPWDATGVIRPDKDPPHKFARAHIEAAINGEGFQLWVTKPMAKAEARRRRAERKTTGLSRGFLVCSIVRSGRSIARGRSAGQPPHSFISGPSAPSTGSASGSGTCAMRVRAGPMAPASVARMMSQSRPSA